MSTTADLVILLKKELKSARMTYADLAVKLGMAESSVKRMLAKGDMPLSRIDAICRALALDFAPARFDILDTLHAQRYFATLSDYFRILIMCEYGGMYMDCLLYTSPSPRDLSTSRMPSSA